MRRIKYMLLIAILAMVGCEKGKTECTFVIVPYIQQVERGNTILDDQARVYMFYADSTQWKPDTWVNAIDGKLKSELGPDYKMFDVMAEPELTGLTQFENLTQGPVIFVVCDQTENIFAWKQYPVEENLERLILRVTFRPWKWEGRYLEEGWRYVDETPAVRP